MKLDDFHPYVIPHVPNLPLPTVEHHLRMAAEEFFRKTHAWQQALDAQLTLADQLVYELDIPAGSQVCKLLEVNVGERDYSKACVLEEPKLMEFQCDAPQAGMSLEVRVALTPTVGAVTATWSLPDSLAQYAKDIAHGALATLYPMVDGKEGMAPISQAKFNARISTVGFNVSRGHGRKRLTRAAAANFF